VFLVVAGPGSAWRRAYRRADAAGKPDRRVPARAHLTCKSARAVPWGRSSLRSARLRQATPRRSVITQQGAGESTSGPASSWAALRCARWIGTS